MKLRDYHGVPENLAYSMEQRGDACLKFLRNKVQGCEGHVSFAAFNLAHMAAVYTTLIGKGLL